MFQKTFATVMVICTLSAQANELKKQKDRQAILAMAGEYKVGFLFKETYSLNSSYKIKNDTYSEEAHEKVFVVSDEANKIVLQHILLAEDIVVKHWGQVWTYEDKKIIDYKSKNTWEVKEISDSNAKGTWSQLVTQTDDSPRYESYGKWVHTGESSSWQGTKTRRPLPRREYTKRKDYDYLVAVNRHSVTPAGWYHEQDNYKQVDREGNTSTLCREVGFNEYMKEAGFDFEQVDTSWNKYADFWSPVRTFWRNAEKQTGLITLHTVVDGKKRRSLIKELRTKFKSGKKLDRSTLQSALAPYLEKR